jgi:hypothetical protein
MKGGIGYRLFKELPSGGFVERTVANCPKLRKRHEDFIVMLLAGREADQIMGTGGSGHRIDYRQARVYARKWLGASSKQECDDIIAKLRARASRLVRKKLGSVILIAKALDEHGTLTARQVRALYA